MLRAETYSLLFAIALVACGPGAPSKPDLPASVSPGWQLKSFDTTAKPADVPGAPVCWLARYSGAGDNAPATADATVCGYPTTGGSFDAQQRSRAEAQAVKFQEGKYFVLVKWTGANKTLTTALVRAIQKSLETK